MKILSKSLLPLFASPQNLTIDAACVEKFNLAFNRKSAEPPPTILAAGLKGVFEILNHLEVDWHHLLHATQSFQFERPLTTPMNLVMRASLKDIRVRGQTAWLHFDVQSIDEGSQQTVATSQSLILVRVDTA